MTPFEVSCVIVSFV